MLRSLFIGLSESKRLRHFAEHSALGLRFSSRFVAGTQLDDVIRATEVVNGWGASVSIDNLGENVTNADESKHSAELYHRLLDEISTRKLNANVSLKLTHMGLDVSEDLAFRLVTELVDHAVRINNFVRVDMEGSPYTQRTLDFVRQLHRLPGHGGQGGHRHPVLPVSQRKGRGSTCCRSASASGCARARIRSRRRSHFPRKPMWTRTM